MRSKNTVRNSIYAITSYAVLSIFSIVVRKLFVEYIDISLLGYEGLFSNVFNILLLADLGVETLINFKLYPAVADDDKKQISKYIYMYKKLYAVIGCIMIVTGVCAIPLLPWVIKEGIDNWKFVIIIYLLQLANVVSTYFLAYKRVVFIVYQREYENTKVDFVASMTNSIIRIVVLAVFKSYTLYLISNLMINVLRNIVISSKVDSNYPFIKNKVSVSFNEINKDGIFKELKNGICGKIAATIYFSVDNILVSKYIGIKTVGLISNYLLILNAVEGAIGKMVSPLQASVGNYVYTHSKEEGYRLFKLFDLVFFILALLVAGSLTILFNPFIGLLFGKEFELSQMYVLALAINQYISWNHRGVCVFRYCFANYKLERNASFIAAIINLIVSIALIQPLGIAGVAIGTAIGNIGFWFGRVKALYTEYVDESVIYYILRQIRNGLIFILVTFLSNYLSYSLPYTILGLIERILFITGSVCVIAFFMFVGRDEYRMMKNYLNVLKDGSNNGK